MGIVLEPARGGAMTESVGQEKPPKAPSDPLVCRALGWRRLDQTRHTPKRQRPSIAPTLKVTPGARVLWPLAQPSRASVSAKEAKPGVTVTLCSVLAVDWGAAWHRARVERVEPVSRSAAAVPLAQMANRSTAEPLTPDIHGTPTTRSPPLRPGGATVVHPSACIRTCNWLMGIVSGCRAVFETAHTRWARSFGAYPHLHSLDCL